MKSSSGQIIFNAFIWLLMSIPAMAIFTQSFLGILTPFIFIAYVITIILGILYINTNEKLRIPRFLWLLILYFFYKFFVDFNFNESTKWSWYLTLRNNLFSLATFFALIMIFSSTISKKYVNILNKYILVLIITAPIATIIQVYNPYFLRADDLINSVNYVYDLRRYSFFGFEDLNALGFTYLPLVFTFISTLSLYNKKKMMTIYLICIGIVLILSNTRYIMFGFLLVLILVIITDKNRLLNSFRYLLVSIVTLILFYYLFNLIGYNFIDFYNERLADERNINARVVSFNAFISIYPHYLFFGIGNEMSPIIIKELHGFSTKIHIGFLNHLMVYGLLGSCLLFGFWVGLFQKLYKRAKKTKYWAALFAFSFFLWANVSLVMYSIFFSGLLLSFILEKYYVTKIMIEKKACTMISRQL